MNFEALPEACDDPESTNLRLTFVPDEADMMYEVVMAPGESPRVVYIDRSGEGVDETVVLDSGCVMTPGTNFRAMITIDGVHDQFIVEIINVDAPDPASTSCTAQTAFNDVFPDEGELVFNYASNCGQRQTVVGNMNLCF